MQDVGHTHCQRRGATGARKDGVFTNVLGGLDQHVRRHREAPGRHGGSHGFRRGAGERGRRVHREVDTRIDHRRRHQSHDGHEGFGQHAAVTNEARLGFVLQHLGRGARRDQCVEAGHRTAGDGDEQEREQVAGPDRTTAIGKTRQRRHLQWRRNDQDTDRQRQDGAYLQEGRQIVARRQQQPHRQHGGDEAVADQDPGQRGAAEGEQRRPGRALVHRLAAQDGQHQQHKADHRNLGNAAGADEAQVDAHEQRHRNRGRHRERAPGRGRQRLDHDQRQHRQDDDHDHEGAEQRDQPGDGAHLLLDQVAQRTPVAPRRDEQHDEVLHRAGKHHAAQNPQHARQVAHLRSQHRADQWAGAGDGGKVVAEQHILICRHIVQTVVMAPGRGLARAVQAHDFGRQVEAVVAVGDQVGADGGHHHPQRADAFTARQRHRAQAKGAQDGNR